MHTYGIATDYDYSTTHKRQRLDIYSGEWMGVWEAEALSLPNRDGYMVTTYNGEKIKVECPSPRTDENFRQVDQAISAALAKHHLGRGDVQMAQNDRDTQPFQM